MLGAASATGMPRWRSNRCLAKVAACAELPRAQVTTSCGGRRSRRATKLGDGPREACRLAADGGRRLPDLVRHPGFDAAHAVRSRLTLPCLGSSISTQRARAPDLPKSQRSWASCSAPSRASPAGATSRARVAAASHGSMLRRGRPRAPAAPRRARRGARRGHRYGPRRAASLARCRGPSAPRARPPAAPGRRSRAACAEPIQRTMACGSDAEFARTPARSEAGPGRAPVVRPQRPAHRLAAEPGAAAFVGDRESPSRRRGNALPPRIAQPMLPVPTMTTPPSRPRCAPTQAACASVVTSMRRKRCSR